jgi:hypothetical protein
MLSSPASPLLSVLDVMSKNVLLYATVPSADTFKRRIVPPFSVTKSLDGCAGVVEIFVGAFRFAYRVVHVAVAVGGATMAGLAAAGLVVPIGLTRGSPTAQEQAPVMRTPVVTATAVTVRTRARPVIPHMFRIQPR